MSQNVKIGKVSRTRIRQLREHGASINSIANKFGFPISVINRICDGIDVEYFIRKPKRSHREAKAGKCTICREKKRDIPKGTPKHQEKWFLYCDRCRRMSSNIEVDEYSLGLTRVNL